ncbi:MAG: GspH/FimT family pseudopilin [Verrucomicrobiota bacterium]|jgi:type II secretion system protein H
MRLENPNSKPVHAFTLIEMVVVVVLIGILSAMIIPEMKGTFDDGLLRSTGRDLINVFNLASSRAVSLNQLYRVTLDTQGGRYFVERQIHDGTRVDFVPLKDVSGAEGKLDSRIVIEISQPDKPSGESDVDNPVPEQNSPDAVAFYPDGTADSAEIKLRDHDGFQLTLRLNPITARVRMTEPERQ